jgi:HEAT repeat protein
LTTDDLEFFLLDIVSTGTHGLPVFDIDNLGECLNKHIPQYTRPELIAALLELFQCGDLEAELKQPSGRRWKPFQPNRDEIEAGIAGALRISYRLTPQGGERWARLVGLDWSLWDFDCWSTTHTGAITTANREFTEFLFERKLRQGKARGPGLWKEVRPWKPVYWHAEPVGYQVRYRISTGELVKDDFFPFVWQEILPDKRKAPVLAPRRQRLPAPAVRPFQWLTEKQLEGRLSDRSARTRLAAGTELGRRADSTELLIKLLRKRCPAIRFAAGKALGRRKVKPAVPALLGVVFEHHDVAAAEALGRIADKRALGPLVTLFECWRGYNLFPEPKFFEAVERAILQFGDQAISKLERLARKSSAVQNRAFHALSQSSSQRAVKLMIQQIPDHSYPVVDLLARMGDEARAYLFHLAADETEAVNSYPAAWALANSHGAFQEEGRRIGEALHHNRTQATLRNKIAFITTDDAEREVDDPVRALIALLKHPSCAKRRAAVDLLAELGAGAAARDIAQLSHDDRWQVRASVARVLARWGAPEEALQRLRRDSDTIVRGCARWLE